MLMCDAYYQTLGLRYTQEVVFGQKIGTFIKSALTNVGTAALC